MGVQRAYQGFYMGVMGFKGLIELIGGAFAAGAGILSRIVFGGFEV